MAKLRMTRFRSNCGLNLALKYLSNSEMSFVCCRDRDPADGPLLIRNDTVIRMAGSVMK